MKLGFRPRVHFHQEQRLKTVFFAMFFCSSDWHNAQSRVSGCLLHGKSWWRNVWENSGLVLGFENGFRAILHLWRACAGRVLASRKYTLLTNIFFLPVPHLARMPS